MLTVEQLINEIDICLQDANNDTPERIKRIDDIMAFLKYNKRLTELPEAAKIDFYSTMEGIVLTENMRKTLSDCTTEEKKNYYMDMWARSTYFKQCAWMAYLHGESNDLPPYTDN